VLPRVHTEPASRAPRSTPAPLPAAPPHPMPTFGAMPERATPAKHATPAPAAVPPHVAQLVAAIQAAAAQGPQQIAAVQAALQALAAQGPEQAAAVQHAIQIVSRSSAPAMPLPAASPFEHQAAAPVASALESAAPFVQFDGGAAFDPLAVPLPPELAPSIYAWLRRLALQADLAAADRLLRDALAELTSSLSVVIIYAGPDGFYTLGPDDELPKDTAPVASVGKARRALVGTHSGLVPISTAAETIAVIQLVRNARQPAFAPADHVVMAAIARESASVMHHLVVEHLQRKTELAADKGSLYRPEALDNHRRKGQEGVVADLSPRWVKRAYPTLVITMFAAIAVAVLVKVPTYSSGNGVLVYPGLAVTAPAPGTVEDVRVLPQQRIRKGDVLIKLASQKEEADLRQATTEYEAAEREYMHDNNDEQVKKSLVGAKAQMRRAEAAIEQKYVRAPKDGIAGDVRVQVGTALQFGDPVLTIVAEGTEPELWAFMPGNDKPQIHAGQELQIDFINYKTARAKAPIYELGTAAMSAGAARKLVGLELADALKLPNEGSFILVKARMPARTFKVKGQTLTYAHGMTAMTEVRIESKRFLVTLLPDLEKWVH